MLKSKAVSYTPQQNNAFIKPFFTSCNSREFKWLAEARAATAWSKAEYTFQTLHSFWIHVLLRAHLHHHSP